jgi:hypothetical protein
LERHTVRSSVGRALFVEELLGASMVKRSLANGLCDLSSGVERNV